MDKPIVLDTEWVRPMEANALPCISCAAPGARWAIGKPPNGYLSCARCFLYSSPWGKENADRLKDFVGVVEREMGRKISDDGIIWANEADRVLSSIVQISGIVRMRSQRGSRDEGTGT